MFSHEMGLALNFHALLFSLDVEAAQQVRLQGCRHCGGPLYAAHYERKARGLDPDVLLAGHYEQRLSLCCGQQGCRKRATPPTLRFLGRHIYAAVAVVVLSLQAALKELVSQPLGVESTPQSPAWWTRRRWTLWWQKQLWSVPWFAAQQAHFATPPMPSRAPDSLLGAFAGGVHERMQRLLVMLCPLTTRSLPQEHARIAMAR